MPENPPPEKRRVEQASSVDAIVAKQPLEVRSIVNSDAVLKGNIGRITNLEDFLAKLEKNQHLFDDTQNNGDNQAARSEFLRDG